MKYADIQQALNALSDLASRLEEAYIENEGEVTEDTEALEEEKAALAELLAGDGIDSLGRWLKAKEDEKATYKAEKAACDARIKAADKTIDFIKHAVGDILRVTGTEKAKGSFYSFSTYDSVKTTFDADALNEAYLGRALFAARAAGLPECIDIQLKTTATRLSDAEGMEEYLQTTTDPTCRFTKPRTPKE